MQIPLGMRKHIYIYKPIIETATEADSKTFLRNYYLMCAKILLMF